MDWWHAFLISFVFFIINLIFRIKAFDLNIIENRSTKIIDIKAIGDELVFVLDLFYNNRFCESIVYKNTNNKYKIGDNVTIGVSYKGGILIAVLQDFSLKPKYKDNIYIAYFCQIFALGFLLLGFFLLIIN